MSTPFPIRKVEKEPLTKFEAEDLPRILAALKNAHDAKQRAKVTVDFSDNGGVVAITLEQKKSFK